MSELSSDILEEQFGPTVIEVLQQKDLIRVIATETADGQILELSRVEFNPDGIGKFPDAHSRVIEGESMGKVFRDSKIDFYRELQDCFRYTLPDNFGSIFGSNEPAAVMDVVILVGPDRIPYARILETYSPHLKKYQGLKRREPNERLLTQIELLDKVLGYNLERS